MRLIWKISSIVDEKDYDEYDNVKKLKPVYIIKVKEKSDALSEPGYISDVDFKEGSFKHSYAIEKAMQLGEIRSSKTYRFLVERFSEKYDFFATISPFVSVSANYKPNKKTFLFGGKRCY